MLCSILHHGRQSLTFEVVGVEQEEEKVGRRGSWGWGVGGGADGRMRGRGGKIMARKIQCAYSHHIVQLTLSLSCSFLHTTFISVCYFVFFP